MGEDERKRIALLEEALAEALAWIREQDTFPHDPSDESSWEDEIADFPSLSVRQDREAVLDTMRRGVAVVANAVDLLGWTEAEDNAFARSKMRSRARERRGTLPPT